MDLSCMKNNLQIVPTKYDKSMDLYTLFKTYDENQKYDNGMRALNNNIIIHLIHLFDVGDGRFWS